MKKFEIFCFLAYLKVVNCNELKAILKSDFLNLFTSKLYSKLNLLNLENLLNNAKITIIGGLVNHVLNPEGCFLLTPKYLHYKIHQKRASSLIKIKEKYLWISATFNTLFYLLIVTLRVKFSQYLVLNLKKSFKITKITLLTCYTLQSIKEELKTQFFVFEILAKILSIIRYSLGPIWRNQLLTCIFWISSGNDSEYNFVKKRGLFYIAGELIFFFLYEGYRFFRLKLYILNTPIKRLAIRSFLIYNLNNVVNELFNSNEKNDDVQPFSRLVLHDKIDGQLDFNDKFDENGVVMENQLQSTIYKNDINIIARRKIGWIILIIINSIIRYHMFIITFIKPFERRLIKFSYYFGFSLSLLMCLNIFKVSIRTIWLHSFIFSFGIGYFSNKEQFKVVNGVLISLITSFISLFTVILFRMKLDFVEKLAIKFLTFPHELRSNFEYFSYILDYYIMVIRLIELISIIIFENKLKKLIHLIKSFFRLK